MTNDTYINALSVGELLRQIAALGYTSPVTFVLDNAKYQPAGIVKAHTITHKLTEGVSS